MKNLKIKSKCGNIGKSKKKTHPWKSCFSKRNKATWDGERIRENFIILSNPR